MIENLSELRRRKKQLEDDITAATSRLVAGFGEATGLGIESIGLRLLDVSCLDGKGKRYIVGGVIVRLEEI